MNVRELLWAATYFWVRRSYSHDKRAREFALDTATESVADFDEFFFEEDEDAPLAKSELERGKPAPLHPLEHVGAWEITDPITWEVDPRTLNRWCELHDWRPNDERALGALREVIRKSHYVKTLAANREFWRTSKNNAGWRLVVEPREGKPSLVVWIGQGSPPRLYDEGGK